MRCMRLQVFALQPRYGADVADMVPALASNLAEVREALGEAAQRLRSGADAVALQSLSGTCTIPSYLIKAAALMSACRGLCLCQQQGGGYCSPLVFT